VRGGEPVPNVSGSEREDVENNVAILLLKELSTAGTAFPKKCEDFAM
jgi:hypothetical protein